MPWKHNDHKHLQTLLVAMECNSHHKFARHVVTEVARVATTSPTTALASTRMHTPAWTDGDMDNLSTFFHLSYLLPCRPYPFSLTCSLCWPYELSHRSFSAVSTSLSLRRLPVSNRSGFLISCGPHIRVLMLTIRNFGSSPSAERHRCKIIFLPRS